MNAQLWFMHSVFLIYNGKWGKSSKPFTVLAMPNHFMKIIFSKARLHEIQTDPSTFCSEPNGMK